MAFQGYTSATTHVSSGAEIFSYSITGEQSDKPLLILLHGYPQNHTMWKEFIKGLPREWSVFIPDLPGYGNSLKVDPEGSALAFSKRSMAADILEAADKVHKKTGPVIAYGHDRGGRVAYRMALDHPDRVVGLAVLDIIPTIYMWHAMRPDNDHKETKLSNHWIFLSAPKPLPETLIQSNAEWYYTWTMTAWSPSTSQQATWVTDSVAPFVDTDKKRVSDRIAAACEDYRAGATYDVDHDREQGMDPAGTTKVIFKVPVLALSSMHLRRRHEVDKIWTDLAGELVESEQVGKGHFLVNEEPDMTAQRTVAWLQKHWK